MRSLSLLGLSHIVFGIILLLAKKKDRSDYILICWLAVIMVPFLQSIFPEFRFLNQAFTLLHGPFLYLYMREVTKRDESKLRYTPHFILFLLFYFILLISPAPLMPGGPGGALDVSEITILDFVLLRFFGIINLLIFLIYAAFSLWELRIHRLKIKDTYAHKDVGLSLVWLSLLPLLFLVLTLFIVLIEHTPLRSHFEIATLHLGVFLLFALYLIFFGQRQKPVYPVKEAPKKDEPEVPATPEKGKTDSGEDAKHLAKIDALMTEAKLYLNPVLSAYDLAKASGLSRHRISALLNDRRSQNFYQYVNAYRLDDVKRRLEDDTENRYNILELAYDSGFNSKSTFNSLFKEKFGQTPFQFKKNKRNQINLSE